jgi:hypothetical protein
MIGGSFLFLSFFFSLASDDGRFSYVAMSVGGIMSFWVVLIAACVSTVEVAHIYALGSSDMVWDAIYKDTYILFQDNDCVGALQVPLVRVLSCAGRAVWTGCSREMAPWLGRSRMAVIKEARVQSDMVMGGEILGGKWPERRGVMRRVVIDEANMLRRLVPVAARSSFAVCRSDLSPACGQQSSAIDRFDPCRIGPKGVLSGCKIILGSWPWMVGGPVKVWRCRNLARGVTHEWRWWPWPRFLVLTGWHGGRRGRGFLSAGSKQDTFRSGRAERVEEEGREDPKPRTGDGPKAIILGTTNVHTCRHPASCQGPPSMIEQLRQRQSFFSPIKPAVPL